MLSTGPTSSRRRLLHVTAFALVAVIAVAVAGTRTHGQAPTQTVSPFDIVGFIQKATLDNPADVMSGGSMTINGHVVTVPANTILQMPAFALTWQEVFAMAPLPYGIKGGNGQSGLALTDSPPPLATYEVHVQGNRIIDANGDRYIAGLIFIAQQSLNVGQGYINYIDYTNGEMRVGGILNDPTTGARVRINDPLHKFSKGDPNADPRFTIDEDNPTVRAQTGYPLCLPRQNPFGTSGVDDQYCPQRNRPQSAPPAFDTVVGGNPLWFSPNNQIGPDSMLPAPFEVGDYIEFAGTLVADPAASGPQVGPYPSSAPSGGLGGTPNAPSGTYISAFQIIANLGFYTQPGTAPVYVAIDVMLMGTGGLNTATAPQEATLRTRVEGFSTDPFGASFTGAIVGGGGRRTASGAGTAINIYAMDSSCSGGTTDRAWVLGVASDIGVVFGGAVAGRWRFRPTGGVFLPPPRNLRATMADTRGTAGARLITANLPPKPGDTTNTPQGLETGQYNAPIFEYIFPENLVIGGPTIANNFNDFPFLANGSGPYFGATGGTTQVGTVGQLNPWPLIPAPSVACSAGTTVLQNAPQVIATASKALANSGDLVTLSATATDINLPPLPITSLTWTAPSGIALSPNSASSPVTFVAPQVTTLTTETFTVTATNSAGLSSSATVTVDINPPAIVQTGAPALTVTGAVGASASVPGSGTLLTAPYTVPYGAVGVQLVAKSTANATINWVKPAAQPNSSALSITGPSNTTNNTTNTTTSWLTFNAVWRNNNTGGPGLVAGNPPAAYVFQVSAKDNKTGATQTQFISVIVVPPPDVLTALVTYVSGGTGGGKASKLQVTVTSTAPIISDPNTLAVLSPQFTLTFVVSDPTDPRFGQTVVWDSWAMVLGVPTATVLGFPMPASVTVNSSAGGSVTVPSSLFKIR